MVVTLVGLAFLVLAFALAAALAVTLGVLARLVLRGPTAAREAFIRGDSMSNWWHARRPAGRDKLGLEERCALAGRITSDLGVIGVEERASHSTYAR